MARTPGCALTPTTCHHHNISHATSLKISENQPKGGNADFGVNWRLFFVERTSPNPNKLLPLREIAAPDRSEPTISRLILPAVKL